MSSSSTSGSGSLNAVGFFSRVCFLELVAGVVISASEASLSLMAAQQDLSF